MTLRVANAQGWKQVKEGEEGDVGDLMRDTFRIVSWRKFGCFQDLVLL